MLQNPSLKLQTRDQAKQIMLDWHINSRLTRDAFRAIDDIAARAEDALGDLPETAMSHSLIVAWLRKQDGIEAKNEQV